MSCSCCFIENGRHNIVLEIVTIVISGLFLLCCIFFGNDIVPILCNVGSIIACSFGIAALKRPTAYWLGYVAVILGVVVFLPNLIFLALLIITLPVILGKYDNVNEMLEDLDLPQHSNDEETNSRGFLITVTIVVLAYFLFGVATMLALIIKHFRICRSRRQGNTDNTVVIGTTTVHYVPPANQPPAPTPYYPGMYPQQPQQQPPPTYEHCEKNKANMV